MPLRLSWGFTDFRLEIKREERINKKKNAPKADHLISFHEVIHDSMTHILVTWLLFTFILGGK